MTQFLTALEAHVKAANYHLQCMEKEQQKQNKKRFFAELQAFQQAMTTLLSKVKEQDKQMYKEQVAILEHKLFFQSLKKKHIIERLMTEKIEVESQPQVIYALKRNNKFDARKGFYHKERPTDTITKLGTYYVQEVKQLAQIHQPSKG